MNPAEKTLRENPNPVKLTPEESSRFWNLVERMESCWVWKTNGKRYGSFLFRGKVYSANRFSWLIHFGEIPHGLKVLHNCPNGDNSLCVNPDHLWLGTQKENIYDMEIKGRSRHPSGNASGLAKHPESVLRGSQVSHAKLTEENVMEIVSECLRGKRGIRNKMAMKFGVSWGLISHIMLGRAWSHLTGFKPVKKYRYSYYVKKNWDAIRFENSPG